MASPDDLPECCGSGCTNCVLDRRRKLPLAGSDVPNILVDSSYHPFRCTGITRCTFNTFLFRFQYAGVSDKHQHQLVIPPGCHLMLRAKRNFRDSRQTVSAIFEQWRSEGLQKELPDRPRGVSVGREKYDRLEEDLYLSRPYTPIRVDREGVGFEVLVKLEVRGVMSEYFTTLETGVVTEWKGVYGEFSWERNRWKHLVAFAQGVGLAPIYSIMDSILDDEEDETRLSLNLCCMNLESVLLRSELESMRKFWNFSCSIYLSRESCTCEGKITRSCKCLSSRMKYKEPIFNHRLEEVDIENVLKKLVNGSFQVLICGNEPFTKFVECVITKYGISDYYKF